MTMDKTDENVGTEEGPIKNNSNSAGATCVHEQNHMDSKQQLLQEMTFEMRKSHDLIMEQMVDLVNEFINKDESPRSSNAIDESVKCSDKKKLSKNGVLHEKQFLPRNSLLTDLFEIKHIKTIYHIFMAILIILLMNAVVSDYVEYGKLELGFELIIWNFSELRTVLIFWVGMMISTLMLYSCFNYWANARIHLNECTLKLWDYGCLLALVVYMVAFLYIPCTLLMARDIPPASSAIILMEQVRLMMKSVAFVRSNIPRAMSVKCGGDSDEVKDRTVCPGFSKFLYFVFAPTLIYRDSYPRTKQIRWRVVAWHFIEIAEIIFYGSFLFGHFLMPPFKKFGCTPMSIGTLTVNVFKSMMPSMLVFLCGFYLLLHAWMNAFAEMMRFSDRMFYKDWWTSSTFATYYRTWNVVVHDWLYTYVYKEVAELLSSPNEERISYTRGRLIPQLMVFAVSALFHEYIITFSLRSFYPVLLIVFGGFGVLLVFLTRYEGAGGNIFMWLTICSGNGIIFSLYIMEWYARKHCPPHPDALWDFILPRSFNCRTLEY